ncbi:MAG TPA: metalloregulator ArsR/SmtB family transcription factor, partial [Roseiflexaceae bacterium]|nr:metalloregulator ArsR/SmtB family transcription factor [Roseiflexaceae bacterium]
EGLYHAVQPGQPYSSFLSYLSDLADTPAELLRQRWLEGTWSICLSAVPRSSLRSAEELLSDIDTYLGFLEANKDQLDYDAEVESEAFRLMQEPERMKRVMLEHIRAMWDDVMSAEWSRVRPMLQDAVQAYQRIPLQGLEPVAAAERVIGQPLQPMWHKTISKAQEIVFVPSAHVGPYLGKLAHAGRVWMLFGARSPEGIGRGASALNSSELLVRLGALADATRLRLLGLLVERGELCAQDLIVELDISQPAASRHLRQLVANSYVTERWRDGSKCYQLNQDRIADTIGALERFFKSPE